MENTALLERFFDAENNRDWDTFKNCLHPEVMWFQHTETTHIPVAGRDEYMEQIKAGYKDNDGKFFCEGMMVSKSGNRISATLCNSNGGRVIAIFDFEDGLIRWEHEFVLEG